MILFLCTVAAQELAWDWSQPHRFVLAGHYVTPESWSTSFAGQEAAYAAISTRLVTTCVRDAELRRGRSRILCTIEQGTIQGVPASGSEGELSAILVGQSSWLKDQVVELVVEPSGRVQRFDIVSTDVGIDELQAWRIEQMAILGFAALGVELGPGESWKQKPYVHGLNVAWGQLVVEHLRNGDAGLGSAESRANTLEVSWTFDPVVGALTEVDLSRHTDFSVQGHQTTVRSGLRRVLADEAVMLPMAGEVSPEAF